MKAMSGGRTFVVQAQDPRTSLDRFDLIVPPKHDRVEGTNVFPILGPPTWWSQAEIAAAQARFPNLAAEAGRKGGRSVAPEARSFSRDPKLAAEAGRKGGEASHSRRSRDQDSESGR